MIILIPHSLEEALSLLDQNPKADILAGGTDIMAEMNYCHRRPEIVLSLRHVAELKCWQRLGDTLRIGASVNYSEIIKSEIANLAPALTQAARTVGSPQIRNTGTIGGNIATASPAGDTLPVLAALNAVVHVKNAHREREIPISEFILGVKRNALEPGELITAFSIPIVQGTQEFLKIGKRNAMVIAVANLALNVDTKRKKVACAIGSVGPTIIRCVDAEKFVMSKINWDNLGLPDAQDYVAFGELCSQAARPIDDHRSSAAYRCHTISIMAQRALKRSIQDRIL